MAREKAESPRRRKAEAPKKTSSAKDFISEEDVKASSSAAASTDSNIIKIREDEKTPLYFLSSKYFDGFAHWVQVASGDKVRVPCCGGLEGGGHAPDVCPICAYQKELYKEMSKQRPAVAKATKERAGDIRGNYECYFIVAQGERTVVKTDGKDVKSRVDFDNARVGLLRLSKAQWNTFRGLAVKFPYIQSNRDLFTRYIVADKQVRDNDGFASIDFVPAKKPTPRPTVAIPDDLGEDDLFTVDEETARKVLALSLLDDDEDGVDYENDEEEDVPAPRGKKAGKAAPAGRTARAVSRDDDDDDDDEYLEEDDTDIDDDDADADVDDDDDDADIDDDDDSDFDDGFLDDIDEDLEDDFEDDVPEEEPALPRRKNPSAPAPRRASKPVKPEPEPARRSRTAKVPEKAPVKTPARGKSAPVEAPRGRPAAKAPTGKAKVAEAPKGRGRPPVAPTKAEKPAPARKPRGR